MNLTLPMVEAMPTIHQGQYENLKYDDGAVRIWLSRMGAEDGETHRVHTEKLIDGRWTQAGSHFPLRQCRDHAEEDV